MFASSSRLDLSITIAPQTQKPGHIKTILSSSLPISIDFRYWSEDVTDNDIWRMRAALGHRDRVREIYIHFGGCTRRVTGVSFGKFFRATSYHFPALESLTLVSSCDQELDIPATFLRGPDQSELRLRRLALLSASLASVSGLLLSATAVTDLTLDISAHSAVFDSSQGSFLFTCLQGMQCLRSLYLTAPDDFRDSYSQHSAPKDIVPLSKLTYFHYSGPTAFLNNFMSGLSAPSLQDASFELWISLPLLFLPRVISDVGEEFRSVSVTFDIDREQFRLSSWSHSGKIDRFKPFFNLDVDWFPDSIKSINSSPTTKFAMTEELALHFPSRDITSWEHDFSLREFLCQFRSVRVLRVDPFIREVALYLQQDDGEGILPVLEEIELSISRLKGYSDEDYQGHAAEELAAFEPFVSARERAGRLVKVYHCEQTPSK